MLKSMMSSPRRRAASFNSPVTLKTYGGRRFMRANSSMLPMSQRKKGVILAEQLTLSKSEAYETAPGGERRPATVLRLRPRLCRREQRALRAQRAGEPRSRRRVAGARLRDAGAGRFRLHPGGAA